MAHKAIVEKFPIVIQHDAMQCGIACMQMVCKFYGREYSQEYLSELCHATVEGVSLLAINETMGSLTGLSYRLSTCCSGNVGKSSSALHSPLES